MDWLSGALLTMTVGAFVAAIVFAIVLEVLRRR